MPTMTQYPPGTPCWVDLSTSDPGASIGSYQGLFGWESCSAPGGEGPAYTFFAPRAERCRAGGAPGRRGHPGSRCPAAAGPPGRP